MQWWSAVKGLLTICPVSCGACGGVYYPGPCHLGDKRHLEISGCLEFFPSRNVGLLNCQSFSMLPGCNPKPAARAERMVIALLLWKKRYLLQFNGCTRDKAEVLVMHPYKASFQKADSSWKQYCPSDRLQQYSSSWKSLLSFLIQYAQKMLSASFTAVCPMAERRNKKGDFFIKPSHHDWFFRRIIFRKM